MRLSLQKNCRHSKFFLTARTAFLLILWLASFSLRAAEKPVWQVVTRPMFVEALRPLAEHRAKEGFQPVISVEDIEAARAKGKTKPAYILLVGDYEARQEERTWSVSGRMCRMYRWRNWQREYFVSDMYWGDRDGDGVPEIPVGRLPVRTVEQLRGLIRKIIAYERQPMRREDLSLPIWTGAPEFNPILDALITQLGWQVGQVNAPPWANLWVIVANPTHRLCGRPEDQSALFSRRMQEGGVLSAMVGHGKEDHFFSMRAPSRYIVYQADHARRYLSPDKQSSPLAIIACYCGDFSGQTPCLGESLLLEPGGPPAVIAATTESQPLTNFYSSISLLKSLDGSPKRLGDLWLRSQKQMLQMRDILLERLLRHVEGKLEEELDMAKVKRDQMLMYAILGDPALRLRWPGRLEAEIKQTKEGWQWRAKKPADAERLYVEFRDEIGIMPVRNQSLDPSLARQEFEKANNQLRFKCVEELDSRQKWGGIFKQSGTWRLTAVGSTKIYVMAWHVTNLAEN